MTKIKNLFLTLLALGASCLSAAAESEPFGTDPDGSITISNGEQLRYLSEYLQSPSYSDERTYLKVKLTADITVTELPPIGSHNGVPFYGEFDGKGHTINYTPNTSPKYDSEKYYRGLFGFIDGRAYNTKCVVKNLIVTSDFIVSGISGISNIGGLAGAAQYTIFDNVWVKDVPVVGNGSNIGGLVGSAESQCEIKNCAVTFEPSTMEKYTFNIQNIIDDFINSPGNVGGIAGKASHTSITNCYCRADVSMPNSGQNLGGIVGSHHVTSNAWTISGCSYVGNLTASAVGHANSVGDQVGAYVGGIAGYTSGDTDYTYSYCTASATITASATDANGVSKAGRIYGWTGSRTSTASAITPRITLSNCYCAANRDAYHIGGSKNPDIHAFPSDDGGYDHPYNIGVAECVSGAAAVALNKAAGRERFAQNICRDGAPFPASITITGDHHGLRKHHSDGGTCALCGLPAAADYAQPNYSDGYYLLGNADHYLWYRSLCDIIMPSPKTKDTSYLLPSFNARLTADIDLSAHPSAVLCEGRVFCNSIFDGMGHTVSGINYDSKNNNIGFIGSASGSDIKNIKFANCHISGYNNVGLAVGNVEDTEVGLIYTSADCNVKGQQSVGGIVGYIKYDATGAVIYDCTNCASVANYGPGYCYYFGGIAGTASQSSIIRCFNAGPVSFGNDRGSNIGGIVGWADKCSIQVVGNTASINHQPSYDMAGMTSVGGLVGYGRSLQLTDTYCTAAYICGNSSNTAALVGSADQELKIANCSYSSAAKNLASSSALPAWKGNASLIGADGSSAATPEEMATEEFFNNAFVADTDYWCLVACRDNGAPLYKGVWSFAGKKVTETGYHAHGAADGAGKCVYCGTLLSEPEPEPEPEPTYEQPALSNDGFYLIAKAEHLQWLQEKLNNNADPELTLRCRLTSHIDLKDIMAWEGIGARNTHEGKAPAFQGEFDGNGKTIRNMRGNADNEYCTGLFSYLTNAYVHDLTLDASYYSGGGGFLPYTGGAESIGLIAQNASNSRFERVTVSGRAKHDIIGGFVAVSSHNAFTDCASNATIWSEGATLNHSDAGYNYVGGFVAYSFSGDTFTRCTGDGALEGSIDLAALGGFVGTTMGSTTFSHCANRADLNITECPEVKNGSCELHSHVGGFVGEVYTPIQDLGTANFEGCYSYGDVDDRLTCGGTFIGKVSGNHAGATFSHCVFNDNAGNWDAVEDYNGEHLMLDNDKMFHFSTDDFSDGTVAAYLGAPWGHKFVDDGTYEFIDAYNIDMAGDRFPELCDLSLTTTGRDKSFYWPVYKTDFNLMWLGDIDADTMWNMTDADFLQGLVLGANIGSYDYDALQTMRRAADINGDSRVTIADMTLFVSFLNRLEAVRKLAEDFGGEPDPWEGEMGGEMGGE